MYNFSHLGSSQTYTYLCMYRSNKNNIHRSNPTTLIAHFSWSEGGKFGCLYVCLIFFLAITSIKILQWLGNFGMFLNYIGLLYKWKIVIVSYIDLFYKIFRKIPYIDIFCSFLMTRIGTKFWYVFELHRST